MAQKPSIPKGTRDYTPEIMVKRNYIYNTIRSVFKLYGFQPIETPAMENLSTLMGKYGEEGDKLLFKVLNSGDFLKKVNDEQLAERNSVKLTNKISEKGLRYDLTVPFARFVVQHYNELTFPFKRYQIQPVWRADRPQKGRYREFYQCDVDVIGSDSLINEVELIQIIEDVYKRLNINVAVKLNNRKVLAGIAETIGEADRIIDITVAIDKLDKIGLEKVNEEMAQKGISDEAIQKLQPILNLSGTNIEKLEQIEAIIGHTQIGAEGVEELKQIFSYIQLLDVQVQVDLDLTLARGLNYYTGAIYEVKALDVAIGSITGGGRYDNLTGIFGLKNMSGVGISFGADRIFDVMEQLELFPEDTGDKPKAMFVNFGAAEEAYCLKALKVLRGAEINAEIYPNRIKMGKQMNYANKKALPFVILVGEQEMADGVYTLKDMNSGEQSKLSLEELLKKLE